MAFPSKVSTRALTACGRCCCLCHIFCGLKIELHHIRQKSAGGKDTFENCIPLCFNCHADMRSYDHRHPIGHKYSETELRVHRENWYASYRDRGAGIPAIGSAGPQFTERPQLEAKLSFGGDVYVRQRIGSSGLLAAIINRGSRVARVREVEVRLRGFNILPQMQRAFGSTFGYTPPAEGQETAPEPVFAVGLVPICKPAAESCSLIEPNQAVRFLLPFCKAAVPIYEAKNASLVSLYAMMDDESEVLLAEGESLHTQLLMVVDLLNGKMAEPRQEISVRQTVISGTKPELDAVGKTNPFPLSLETNPAAQSTQLEPVMSLFQLIWNNWMFKRRFEYSIIPSVSLDGLKASELREVRFWVGVGSIGFNVDAASVTILFKLIGDQWRQYNDVKGNLKNPSEPQFSSIVRTDPTDEEIALIVSQLKLEAPNEKAPAA